MEENDNNNSEGTEQSNYVMNQGMYQNYSSGSQENQRYMDSNMNYNQQYSQQGYGGYQGNPIPPQPQQNLAPVMTVGDWIITCLLLAIPIANLVLLFVWAFDSGTNPNKKNFCRASLIFIAISFGLLILFFILIGSLVVNMIRWS